MKETPIEEYRCTKSEKFYSKKNAQEYHVQKHETLSTHLISVVFSLLQTEAY